MIDGRVGRLLADPKAWTKKAFARDEKGEIVPTVRLTACSFCLEGAVAKAYQGEEVWEAERLLRVAIRRRMGSSMIGIIDFNDRVGTTHADILAVLHETGV